MADTKKLNYTAAQVNTRLAQVETNTTDITDLSQKIGEIDTALTSILGNE